MGALARHVEHTALDTKTREETLSSAARWPSNGGLGALFAAAVAGAAAAVARDDEEHADRERTENDAGDVRERERLDPRFRRGGAARRRRRRRNKAPRVPPTEHQPSCTRYSTGLPFGRFACPRTPMISSSSTAGDPPWQTFDETGTRRRWTRTHRPGPNGESKLGPAQTRTDGRTDGRTVLHR